MREFIAIGFILCIVSCTEKDISGRSLREQMLEQYNSVTAVCPAVAKLVDGTVYRCDLNGYVCFTRGYQGGGMWCERSP